LEGRVREETNQKENGNDAQKQGCGDTRSQPDQETEEESDRYADGEVQRIHPFFFDVRDKTDPYMRIGGGGGEEEDRL